MNEIKKNLNTCLDVRVMKLPQMKVVSSTHENCSVISDKMQEFVNWTKGKK